MQKGRKIGKRIAVIFLALFLLVALVFGVGWLGALCADLSWTHWRPDYGQEDIASLIESDTLSEDDYALIYRQTGLTKVAIDDLKASKKTERILNIQKAFFAKTTVNKRCFAPFTYIERLDRNIPLALLQDGDIVISAATRVSFFRYGHAALVVDGEYGRILEALEPGSESKVNAVTTLSDMANFIILRPKVDRAVREQVAQAAL
ncbi:MAG: hypothetical protein IJX18_01765, partial [Clostridia bacterium]|nr:hypothetical protein [Clostridia bacterium]